MKMVDFVALCLNMNGEVFDKCEEAFGVDIGEYEVCDALYECKNDWSQFGRIILEKMWSMVVEEYSDKLNEEYFDCDCTSTFYPNFYYKGKRVRCREDLDRLVEQEGEGEDEE